MTIFHQLGDPVAGAGVCLCQHHGAAYAETPGGTIPQSVDCIYENVINDAVIVQIPITITERCCVVVNAAIATTNMYTQASFEIERPLGTIRTQQEDSVLSNHLLLTHHASWEVLDPGTYTYFLVNRHGGTTMIFAAWIKAIASDCEG